MSNIKKLFIIIIFCLFLTPNYYVFADSFNTLPFEGEYIGDVCIINICKNIKAADYHGFASGTNSNESSESKSKVNLQECGKEGKICFGGQGIYLNLVKYDAASKTEMYVGNPVLLYTAGFLETRTSLFNGEVKTAMGPFLIGRKEFGYYYSTPSVLVIYPKNKISFSPRGKNGTYSYLKKIQISNIGTENGYADFVNSYINSAVEQGKNKGVRPILSIAKLFDYENEMARQTNELDKFYISIEVADRVMTTPISKWAFEGDTTKVDMSQCHPGNCKFTWASVAAKATVYTNTTCKLTGETVNCSGFGEISGSGKSRSICNKFENGTTTGETRCAKVSTSTGTTYSFESYNTGYPDTCNDQNSTMSGKYYYQVTKEQYYCPLTFKLHEDPVACALGCVRKNADGTTTEGNCKVYRTYNYKVCKIQVGDFESNGTGLAALFGEVTVTTYRPDFQFTYGTEVRGVRDTGNTRLALRLYEEVGPGTQHIIYEKDGVTPTGRYDYYVGPNAKEAMVGLTSNNKYQLLGKDKSIYNITRNDVTSRNYTLGVAYFWLPGIEPETCKSVCSSYSGNELLKCAENFCDNSIGYQEDWDVSKQKRNCITKCGYNPKPNNCKAMSVEYKKQTNIENTVDNCTETWCHNDSNEDNPKKNIPIDQKTYVNVACSTGITGLNFTGPEPQTVLPGKSVDYRLIINREKKCLVWFDEETWKLDYASLHSKDTVCLNANCSKKESSRKLLEKILKEYNAAANEGKYTGEIANSIASYYDTYEKDTLVQWQHTNLTLTDNDGNDTASAIVTLLEKTDDRTLVDNAKERLVKVEEKLNNTYTAKIGVSETIGFNRLSSTGTIKVNRYLTKSSSDENFAFRKMCVSTDGNGTVYPADDSGVCYKNRDISQGKNVYYTSMQGVGAEGYELEVSATADIKYSENTPSVDPTSVNQCTRTKNVTQTDLGCDIKISENSGTILINGGLYNGPNGVNAKLNPVNRLNDDEIIYYGIFVDPSNEDWKEFDGQIDSISSIKPKGSTGIEPHKVYCMVKTRKGKVAYGSKEVKLTNCNNTKCTITHKNGDIYVLNTSNKVMEAYVTTDDSTINKLPLSINGNKFEFTLKTNNSEGFRAIVATVKDASGSSCCIYANQGSNCREWNKDYKYSTDEVTKWCNANYLDDVSGYKSPTECVAGCTQCPFVTKCDNDSIDQVTNYCNTLYAGNKEDVQKCMSRCYTPVCSSDKVIYRPIDVNDPFPNSPVSPIDKGNRIIGANWVGFTDYITNDLDDQTSLTGPNKGSEVEYIIDLTPNDIRNIREDNNKKGSLDSYTELIYSTELDNDYQGKYRSSFIHDDDKGNGGFASIFSKIPE